MWLVLLSSVLLMAFLSSKLTLQMDITSFLPSGGDTEVVFKNLKSTDRIVVMIKSDSITDDVYDKIELSEIFKERLLENSDTAHISTIQTMVDVDSYNKTIDFIYNNLPFYLDESDYRILDSLLTENACEAKMQDNYTKLTSPLSVGLNDLILRDPLGIGHKTVAKLANLNIFDQYLVYDDYLFSKDLSTLYVFVESKDGSNSSLLNDELITSIESTIDSLNAEYPNTAITYFGGAGVAVYNMRQVKSDLFLTVGIALVSIIVLVCAVYRRKRTILLFILPVVYGFLFSLSVIYLTTGSISAIAVGVGSIIMGVALSYPIHVISHSYYSSSAEELIKELSSPLTIGGITTIGAFIGLLFTNSSLLQDFGLFAATNIIGTSIFCLLFLPHFLSKDNNATPTIGLKIINKINNYPYDRNKYLIGALVLVTVVALFNYDNVGFNSDMMDLNYMPEHLKQSQIQLEGETSNNSTLIVSCSAHSDSAILKYRNTLDVSKTLMTESKVEKISSVSEFLLTETEQQEKINRWNEYWTADKKAQAKSIITTSAIKSNFKENTFNSFIALLDSKFATINMLNHLDGTLLSSFIEKGGDVYLLSSHVAVNEDSRTEVYEQIGSGIIDRSYFIGEMATDIKDNFNLILGISSALIFFVLLISYGRIELAMLAFLPMFISWIIILGFMSIFSVQFNIVSIILSTFIFGIGDDFSIFVLDGLINDYKNQKRTLLMHKTAIFFSALMTILGMGVLVLAKHPAMYSLGLVSLLGILVVVIVSYTLQPLLFRIFISNEASKAGLPQSIGSLIRTIVVFATIGLGCFILPLVMFLSLALPIKFEKKRRIFRYLLGVFARVSISSAMGVKCEINRNGEEFKKQAIIVPNHQSLADLLMVFSINPSIVVVTQGWVFKSPLFGLIVRIAGYLPANSGIESIEDKVKDALDSGLSILVFPEGTRSRDLKVHRFHKGAFYLAEKFNVDIVPAVIYGSGMLFSKNQPQYVSPGVLRMDLLPRITPQDDTFGKNYRERTKNIRVYVDEHLQKIRKELDSPINGFYRSALIKQYIFKDRNTEYSVYLDAQRNNWYQEIEEKVDKDATVLDLNCEYGQVALMLSMTSEGRTVYAYSPCAEDIEIASNSYFGKKIKFVTTESADELPMFDAIILHTKGNEIDIKEQELLNKFRARLTPSGSIILKKRYV